jgi:hypothetical protein
MTELPVGLYSLAATLLLAAQARPRATLRPSRLRIPWNPPEFQQLFEPNFSFDTDWRDKAAPAG